MVERKYFLNKGRYTKLLITIFIGILVVLPSISIVNSAENKTFNTNQLTLGTTPFYVFFVTYPGGCTVTLEHLIFNEKKITRPFGIIGYCWFKEVYKGTYFYRIEKSGYARYVGSIDLRNPEVINVVRIRLNPLSQ
jgi:hypothetical protein